MINSENRNNGTASSVCVVLNWNLRKSVNPDAVRVPTLCTRGIQRLSAEGTGGQMGGLMDRWTDGQTLEDSFTVTRHVTNRLLTEMRKPGITCISQTRGYNSAQNSFWISGWLLIQILIRILWLHHLIGDTRVWGYFWYQLSRSGICTGSV